MTASLLSSPTTTLLEKMAVFGERRHEILAGNVANINTPHYRMRDLPVDDFQQALKAAVQELQRRPSLTAAPSENPSAGNVSPASVEEFFPQRLFESAPARPGNLTFQDDNNRSIERQVMELTKNSLMQNFVVEMLRFQMQALQTVISEQV